MIGQMTFAAEVFVGQGAADHPIDLTDFGPALQLTAKQTKTEIVFAFRGDGGRTSEVTLALPDTLSIFEVDPRGSEPIRASVPSSTRNGNCPGPRRRAACCSPWSRAAIGR